MTEEALAVDDLYQMVDDCREEANRNGERFNLFRIAKHQRSELQHSRFLGELLNPHGSHGEGEAFLQAFLSDALGLKLKGPFRVKREFSTEENRFIDLVIESPEHAIGIELKVDAGDQPAQLAAYHNELKQRAHGQRGLTLVYLTLDGKRASKGSLRGLDDTNVVRVSFNRDLTRWLQRCVQLSEHKPLLKGGILQYHQVVKDLTGQGGSVADCIARNLKEDQEKLTKALEIEKGLRKAKVAIQQGFWEQLKDKQSETFDAPISVYRGYTGDQPSDIKSIASGYFGERSSQKHVGLKVRVWSSDDGSKEARSVWLYTNLYNAVHYGLRVEDGEGRVVPSPKDKEIFQNESVKGNAVANGERAWLISFYYHPVKGDPIQAINFDDFNEAARGLADADTREELIDHIVEHQLELAEQARRIFDSVYA